MTGHSKKDNSCPIRMQKDKTLPCKGLKPLEHNQMRLEMKTMRLNFNSSVSYIV